MRSISFRNRGQARLQIFVIVTTSLVIFGAGILFVSHSAAASSNSYSATPPFGPDATPIASVPFSVLINGSTTYPSYTVSAGESIVLFIRIQSSETVSGLSLSARAQEITGMAVPTGLTMQLPINQVNAPTSGIPLRINVGSTLAPGTYPMAVDAEENNVATGGQIGFQAGFNLIVVQPS